MKITNATNYQTADLRAIVAKVAADELEDHPRKRLALRVEVVYTRGGGVGMSGIAWRRSCRVRLRVPRTNAGPVLFAWLAAHEIAHVRGMGHRKMPDYLNHFTATSRERWGWAAAFPLRQAAPVQKSALAAYQARLAHVQGMLRLADTRLKRATTIRAKWARRVSLAQKRLAQAELDQAPVLDLVAAGRGVPEEK
jgi:hypothetical protein